MATAAGHLEEVGVVVGVLTDLGFEPVLVGGMALVILGSRRVTRDFDFVLTPISSTRRLVFASTSCSIFRSRRQTLPGAPRGPSFAHGSSAWHRKTTS
jgi:hypothetical protein